MKDKQAIQVILQDQLSIPARLLSDYPSVGLDEKELVIVLKIYQYQIEGVLFPTPEEITAKTTIDQQECAMLLRQLIQKGLLEIEESSASESLRNEYYSLEPLWAVLYTNKSKKKDDSNKQEQMNIFILFEQEFGRALSPIEIETINIWIDQDEQQPALIKAALREAVLMSKLNFKYIDRILREWKRQGIHTVEQARQHSKAFHTGPSQVERKETTERDASLYYNWLEED
ncbi:DNA replication protein DnaD [Paraliobacillus ryukyuensis]|uniref:DNA replication protein DnaD n=1 Tax=Paraliobacillus ryukyuensis TaxID=200904 RepID=A0A366EGM9_9BACI|nr:DnaD domain-containing protein [Paraliobacillus ryukyuensis]RBP01562.1 DNA replication protein DnaD [Paraliobacillus ryukyuensis]